MDTATNTRPLLQQSETDSDFEDDLQIDRSPDNFEEEVVVLAKDTKPIFKAREPSDSSMNLTINSRNIGEDLPSYKNTYPSEHVKTTLETGELSVKPELKRIKLYTRNVLSEKVKTMLSSIVLSLNLLSPKCTVLLSTRNNLIATLYLHRFNLAYIIFYFLGTTVLLPWFFFITAAEYWKYKFRPISNNLTSIIGTDLNIDLEASFTPYISIASTVPSTVFLVINPMCSHKIPLCIRMVGSLALMLILFIVTTVFVEINTDAWQDKFFLMTMGIVVLLNIASAVLQSGLFGVVGRFPSRYITAVVSGQALGGVVAALANIVALWVGASAVRSALVYFVMADVFIFFAMLAYVLLSRTMFFKYYMMEAVEYAPVNQPPIVRNISYTGILKKIWVHGFSVFFCFVVSLSMYPAITTLVSSEKKGNNSAWNDVYFVPVVAYLIMSVMDYFGRIFAGLLQLPQKRAWVVGMLSLLRVVFFPLLLLCNAQPRHHLPVLIHSDILYILIVVMFGFTNGYLANITMICVPKIVELHEQEVASSMMAAFLGVGLACGSFLSLLMVNII